MLAVFSCTDQHMIPWNNLQFVPTARFKKLCTKLCVSIFSFFSARVWILWKSSMITYERWDFIRQKGTPVSILCSLVKFHFKVDSNATRKCNERWSALREFQHWISANISVWRFTTEDRVDLWWFVDEGFSNCVSVCKLFNRAESASYLFGGVEYILQRKIKNNIKWIKYPGNCYFLFLTSQQESLLNPCFHCVAQF